MTTKKKIKKIKGPWIAKEVLVPRGCMEERVKAYKEAGYEVDYWKPGFLHSILDPHGMIWVRRKDITKKNKLYRVFISDKQEKHFDSKIVKSTSSKLALLIAKKKWGKTYKIHFARTA